MSAKSKFNSKVCAIKKLGEYPDKEARALAKSSRLVRLKKKRLLLRGPKKRLYGSMHLHQDGTLHVRFPVGVQVELEDDNHSFLIKPPVAEEKPKKKKQGKQVDNAPEAK